MNLTDDDKNRWTICLTAAQHRVLTWAVGAFEIPYVSTRTATSKYAEVLVATPAARALLMLKAAGYADRPDIDPRKRGAARTAANGLCEKLATLDYGGAFGAVKWSKGPDDPHVRAAARARIENPRGMVARTAAGLAVGGLSSAAVEVDESGVPPESNAAHRLLYDAGYLYIKTATMRTCPQTGRRIADALLVV